MVIENQAGAVTPKDVSTTWPADSPVLYVAHHITMRCCSGFMSVAAAVMAVGPWHSVRNSPYMTLLA
jgi:hypothetical protein